MCVCLLYMCVHTRILGLPAQTQYFLCRKERFWQVPLNYACTCMHMNTLGEYVIRQDAHTHTKEDKEQRIERGEGGREGLKKCATKLIVSISIKERHAHVQI